MARIATGKGDRGDTRLASGVKVPKHHPRVEAYGAVDELNALLAMVLQEDTDPQARSILVRVQHELFVLGSDLATPAGTELPRIAREDVERLDRELDRVEPTLPPLKRFIIPGGTRGAAWLHLARTVCRRAERRTVQLARQEQVNPHALVYLNRLSDLLFLLARRSNMLARRPDVPWHAPGRQGRKLSQGR